MAEKARELALLTGQKDVAAINGQLLKRYCDTQAGGSHEWSLSLPTG